VSDTRYVLDTSALLTLIGDEEGADTVAAILHQAGNGQAAVYASFMTYMEVYYRVWRQAGKATADVVLAYLKSLALVRVDVNEPLLIMAGEIKARYRLSVADAWIAATAIWHDATLVHKDPEFEPLDNQVKLMSLPYRDASP
jgi:ribonuclease VapC